MSISKMCVQCKNCLILFDKELRYVKSSEKKGRDHFCSLSCNAAYRCKTDKRFTHTENLKRGGSKDEFSDFRFYLRKARTRKKNNNLTLQDIKECWEKQKGLCAFTSIPIKLNGHHKNQFECASLDRIDSDKPYEVGNIQFVALPLNYAKNNSKNDEFINFLNKIRKT